MREIRLSNQVRLASVGLLQHPSRAARRARWPDSLARTLEVLRLDSGRWTIVSTWSGVVTVRAEPFDAVEIDLSLLWEDTSP
jgi:hypothetical protein